MDIEGLRNYCIGKKGVAESFPFDEHTLTFKVMGKVFAIASLERKPTQVNLKCDPERAVILRETHDGAIIPGYHMNKKHWNTLYIEQLSPELIKELVDHSYDLVVSKLSKKDREVLLGL